MGWTTRRESKGVWGRVDSGVQGPLVRGSRSLKQQLSNSRLIYIYIYSLLLETKHTVVLVVSNWSWCWIGWSWLCFGTKRPMLFRNKLCRRPPQYATAPCKLTISSYLFARWHLLRHVGYLRHQQQVNLWHFDPGSGVRVTGDVATSVPILVFLGLFVLDLGPM